ncbi:MAG: type II/IV secretion system ATPase subunit [Candidatus Altiarchaeota archaeon]|nr:type II/IV secretion system ATPase subunit [Candidatus Altiarchaeota archaeon]
MDYRTRQVGDKKVLEMNLTGKPFPPAIEESEACMEQVILAIRKLRKLDLLVLIERRIREYDERQTGMLVELANSIDSLKLSAEEVRPSGCTIGEEWVEFAQMISRTAIRDPIGAYVELKREKRWQEIEAGREVYSNYRKWRFHYVKILTGLIETFESLQLIKLVQPLLEGYKIGDRTVYRRIFRPSVRPNFTFTKLMAQYPAGEEIDSYKVGEADVTIIRKPEGVRLFYHILPPEFKLSEIEYSIIEKIKEGLIAYKPKTDEMVDPQAIRDAIYNIAADMIEEEAHNRRIKLDKKKLADIITRETVGFGVLELLLMDAHIQDITINAPLVNPVFVYHADAEDCETNIFPTYEETQSWAARLRLQSGRPLDESNPVLDTHIEFGQVRARVAAITKSLSPFGLSFAIRRHRAKPWTLPLFIKHGMMSPLAAGLISFFVDGSRTMLVAGTRGAGKTSVLQSLMTEIMRRYRIITIEDTLELPVRHFMELGYNIQPMKVRSPIVGVESELDAAAGIRTSLRLGDSALIIGEVRSKEAIALYEAMRVGALANVVAGTIHGDSPYGVFDRVVNDLGIPRTSFKATDIILVANPIKTADGLHKARRLVQITEVRKHWEDDPLREHGFVDLMKYNAKTDRIEPTKVLLDGESEVINSIAGRVRAWVGNFDEVWDNIELRAKIKQRLVEVADSTGKPELLEAGFVVQSNDIFHMISDSVSQELGAADAKEVYVRWERWLGKNI